MAAFFGQKVEETWTGAIYTIPWRSCAGMLRLNRQKYFLIISDIFLQNVFIPSKRICPILPISLDIPQSKPRGFMLRLVLNSMKKSWIRWKLKLINKNHRITIPWYLFNLRKDHRITILWYIPDNHSRDFYYKYILFQILI